METFIAVLHILVAIVLISLVLIQDSKGGSMGGVFGGGGSNSVLGATGAATLAQKLTRWTAVLFAGTCIALSIFSAQSNKSVLDSGLPASNPAETATAPGSTTAPSANPTPEANPADAGKTPEAPAK